MIVSATPIAAARIMFSGHADESDVGVDADRFARLYAWIRATMERVERGTGGDGILIWDEVLEGAKARASQVQDQEGHALRVVRRTLTRFAETNAMWSGRLQAARFAIDETGPEIRLLGWLPHGARSPYRDLIFLVSLLSRTTFEDLFDEYELPTLREPLEEP